jgi:hypothetical protein
MSRKNRYPSINIRSKNELAKQISGKELPYDRALALINDVVKNFSDYWDDSPSSDPIKEKYIRSAVGTPLGRLLKLVDKKVLAPNDRLVPTFIFGGVAGKSHVGAAYHILGIQRDRVILGLDIKRFFETVSEERVFHFFNKKCGCSVKASRLLATLCCVPLGPKGGGGTKKCLARGFATSPRLSLWCNLDTFVRLQWATYEKFRGHDPRIAIFVDDIGITASRVSEEDMGSFSVLAENILATFDENQPLPINIGKKHIASLTKHAEHLGLTLGRNIVTPGFPQNVRNGNALGKNKVQAQSYLSEDLCRTEQ